MELMLSEDDLQVIQDKLWNARSNWYNIGLGLRMKTADLDVIDEDHSNSDTKFRKMLTKWLRSGKNCTHEALCKALSAPSVDYSSLVKSVQQLHTPTLIEGQFSLDTCDM